MAILIILEELNGGPWFLLRDGSALIGREPGAAVCLDSLDVSRRHALIRRDGDTVLVEDVGSTNGTYVNDVAIHRRTLLTEKDTLRVGPYLFAMRLQPTGQVGPPARALGAPMVVRAKCGVHGRTFIIVFNELPEGGWLAGKTFKRPKGGRGPARHPGQLVGIYCGDSYAGCPYCANKSFSPCGICGTLSCLGSASLRVDGNVWKQCVECGRWATVAGILKKLEGSREA
jgi:hypothetical protein